MAAHLRGYPVITARSDGLGRASGTRGPEARERCRSPLLVDGTADVLATGAITGAVEHSISNVARGTAHA